MKDWETSIFDGFVDLTMDSDNESDAIIIDSDYESDVERNQIDVPQCQPPLVSKIKKKCDLRNGPIAHPFEVLDHWPEHDLRPGKTVEIKSKDGKD